MIAGLDLSAPDWRIAEAPALPDAAAEWTARETVGSGAGSELWPAIEQPLRLSSPPKLELPHSEADWLNAVVESYHAQLRLSERFKSSQAALAVATPYAASPVVRRVMHRIVFGSKTSPPNGYVVCEAPLAFAIELLAQGRIKTPWTGRLLTSAGKDLELTTLTIQANAARTELRIDFHGSVRWPARNADSPPPSLAPRLTPSEAPSGDCFVAGEDLAAAAYRIVESQRSSGGAPTSSTAIRVADDWAVARGAARYAACAAYASQSSMVARFLGGWKKLVVSRVLARTLGAITTNADGEGFWRRLFQAGEPAASLSAELLAGIPTGGTHLCVLAETADANASPLWLNCREWDSAGLVIHSSHEVPRSSGSSKLRLQLRLREHLRLWDDSFVRIAWQ